MNAAKGGLLKRIDHMQKHLAYCICGDHIAFEERRFKITQHIDINYRLVALIVLDV